MLPLSFLKSTAFHLIQFYIFPLNVILYIK